jgi:hypothetical protein
MNNRTESVLFAVVLILAYVIIVTQIYKAGQHNPESGAVSLLVQKQVQEAEHRGYARGFEACQEQF